MQALKDGLGNLLPCHISLSGRISNAYSTASSDLRHTSKGGHQERLEMREREGNHRGAGRKL